MVETNSVQEKEDEEEMTIEKLKSQIQFSEHEAMYGRRTIRATIEISSERTYDPDAFKDTDDLIKQIKEELRISILNRLYEDQRVELSDAIMELRRANPMDYGAVGRSFERIMRAARFQKPST